MHHDRDSRKEFEEVGLKAKAEYEKRVAKGSKTKPASPKVTKPKTPRPTARDAATSKAKPADFFNHGGAGGSFDEYHASEDAVGAGSREDVLRRGHNGRAEASETGLRAKEEFQKRMRHKRAAKNGVGGKDEAANGKANAVDKGRSGGGALGQRARDTSNFEDMGIGDRGRLDTNASVDFELSLAHNNNNGSKPSTGAPSSSASGASVSFDNGNGDDDDDDDDGLDFDFKAGSSGDAKVAVHMERQTSVASSIGAEGFARFQMEDGDDSSAKQEGGEGTAASSKSSSRRVNNRVHNPRKPLANQVSGVSSIGEEGFAAMAGGLGDDSDDGLDFDVKASGSGASEIATVVKAPRSSSGRSPVGRPKGKAVRKRGGAAATEEV